MKKEVLSEIDQMKYLFGYKAGKVISEQANAPVTADTKQETQFFTQDGVTYKFPGIKDEMALQKFRRVPSNAEIVGQMNIPQSWLDIFNRETSDKRGTAFWNLKNGVYNFLSLIAQEGITPERMSEPSVKNWFKGQPQWRYIETVTTPDSNFYMMSEDEFFKKLGDFIKIRANEIKS